MSVLGLDVAKESFHAALLQGDRIARKAFPNNARGYEQLDAWLRNRDVECVHACLEATGGWSEALALHLHTGGHTVSIVNPHRIRAFGQSEGLRAKTDAADAALIARYCAVHAPEPWTPARPEVRALQALSRRRGALIEMRTQETNRLSGPETNESVRSSVAAHVSYLDAQIAEIEREIDDTINKDPTLRNQRDLLETIPGIAHRTATSITAEMPNLAEFHSGKSVAAHAGLSPIIEQSGTSLARSRLSRTGNARLRHSLYFPAIVAMKFNPAIRAFAGRLRARQKRPMVVIAAAMRKLLVLAYGVVKSGRPFDPSLTS